VNVRATPLPGVLVLEPKVFRDDRGFFAETFSTKTLAGSGIPSHFGQDNHSRSTKGVLRGLHYQLRSPQGKLVHAARGKIFDVAVDIRLGSPNFGRWFGEELSDENLFSMWIPPGFAHGFCVMSDVADVIYKCTTLYDPADDRGVAWNDKSVGITWPEANPIVSAKDSKLLRLTDTRADLPRFTG
jgi:dTDP-4-dehydrorhamnose 3,5-epimerase